MAIWQQQATWSFISRFWFCRVLYFIQTWNTSGSWIIPFQRSSWLGFENLSTLPRNFNHFYTVIEIKWTPFTEVFSRAKLVTELLPKFASAVGSWHFRSLKCFDKKFREWLPFSPQTLLKRLRTRNILSQVFDAFENFGSLLWFSNFTSLVLWEADKIFAFVASVPMLACLTFFHLPLNKESIN